MATVERNISAKEVRDDTVVDTLNKELVPVVRAIRSVVNTELRSTTAVIGDGVSLVHDVVHPLRTLDVFVAAYSIATGIDRVPGTDYAVERLDSATVRLTYVVAPVSDQVLIRV